MLTPPHIRRIQDAAEAAREARSLLRLWDAMENYAELCATECVGLEEGGLDLVDLPRFSGGQPGWVTERGVEAVLSWDEDHVLCAMENGKYRLIARSAQAA